MGHDHYRDEMILLFITRVKEYYSPECMQQDETQREVRCK